MPTRDSENVQPTETQRAETAANRFSDMAEGGGTKNQRTREIFQNVGDETRSGNFDKAQRLLEGGVTWDDNLRSAATEVNRLDQEKRGARPISFEDAQKMTDVYALRHEAQATRYDEGSTTKAAHLEHATNLRGASRPGVEGVDDTLQYIEQGLKDMADAASKGPLTREELQDWQEKRAIRDALYQEKQKRVEQMKQSQRGTEELTKGRGETAHRLESLFGQAAIPEALPMRQEFSARVGHMSPEELRFLDAALKKTLAEFARTGRTKEDTDRLEAQLSSLSAMSFSRSAVERRQKDDDARKIAEIRRKMELPEQQPEEAIARKKRLEEFIKREKEARTPESPQRETTRIAGQEREQTRERIEDVFQALVDSTEAQLNRLSNEERGDSISLRESVGATMRFFNELYPDKQQQAGRIREIFGQWKSSIEEERRKHPGQVERIYEFAAVDPVVKRMSETEQKTLEKISREHDRRVKGGISGSMLVPHDSKSALKDFFDYLQVLEGSKK